jgi:hypothetical protein
VRTDARTGGSPRYGGNMVLRRAKIDQHAGREFGAARCMRRPGAAASGKSSSPKPPPATLECPGVFAGVGSRSLGQQVGRGLRQKLLHDFNAEGANLGGYLGRDLLPDCVVPCVGEELVTSPSHAENDAAHRFTLIA